MTVLVAGATGYAGRAVVKQLIENGNEVLALVRSPTAASVVAPARAICSNIDGYRDALRNESFSAVISCIASRNGAPKDAWAVDYEANRALLRVATESSAETFVMLSALCVQKPKLEFQRAKLAFEAELKVAPITHSIVRPTAFFKSLAGQIKRVRDGRPFVLVGDGAQTACKPISARDLAAFLVSCLDEPTRQNAVLPVGGPGPAVTPLEQGELLFRLLGKTPKFRKVPRWVFDGIVGALGAASNVWPGLEAKAELARIGRYYATESMLVWDPKTLRYDASATPEFGNDTLEDFYQQAILQKDPAKDLGEHAVF